MDCVDELKILGLTIDKNLSWKPHINNICSKVSCLIGLMWRIRNYMSYKMKLLFHNAFILSRIDYCLCIWEGASHVYLEKLHKIQKHAARIILNLNIMEMESHKMFNSLEWMNIYERINYKRCIYMYKIYYNHMPLYITDKFIVKSSKNYCLRSSTDDFNFIAKKPRMDLYKKSLMYSGVILWNNLSVSVKQLESLPQFKYKLRYNIFN